MSRGHVFQQTKSTKSSYFRLYTNGNRHPGTSCKELGLHRCYVCSVLARKFWSASFAETLQCNDPYACRLHTSGETDQYNTDGSPAEYSWPLKWLISVVVAAAFLHL
ncbi:hypothetical protein PoB_002193500 [Plakobranchus ocellatus]|uniref:Uncharacterized protein n=1 Tax=Plakobranchus ocellatus TaxID=259542 RepID=A0AAV3ZJV8_9GAST|nr:hypothetical protein PoB_002193500 [Plakobranchus ocellatus]